MQTELYIEDQLVDLSASVSFPITKQFEDMQDPTAILNEFSKTVSLPFSNINDRLFGLIFNPTRATISDGQEHPNAGIWFDPTKKMKARLMFNGNILLQGYAKMTGIKRSGGTGVYEINLFGELGSFFAEAKTITWDKMTEDLAGNEFTIDRDIVVESWTNEPDLTTDSVEDAATTDIIGFACCNQGLNEDFDSKSLEDANGISELKERLETAIGTSYNLEGIIGDGLTPRQMCDFRSYHQLPFIYMPRFFEIVKRGIEANTDYKLQLHEDWFFAANPYYQNVVMMLSRLKSEGESVAEEATTFSGQVDVSTTSGPNSGNLGNTNTFTLPDEGTVTFRLIMPLSLKAHPERTNEHILYMTNLNALRLRIYVQGSNGTNVTTTKYLATNDQGGDAETIIIPENTIDINDGGFSTTIGYEISATKATYGASVSIRVAYDWINMSADTFVYKRGGIEYRGDRYCDLTYNATIGQIWSKGAWRSGFKATLADVWNSDDTPWTVVVKYCKMFGLLMRYDILTKTCVIMPRATYFGAGHTEDWSKVLDMSRDYVIAPSSFDTKYIAFNPSDDTDKGEAYKEKIGLGFGGAKIDTGYDFNSSMKDIAGGKAPIFSSENTLPWSRMLLANFTYRNTEPMVYAANDGKPADMFGTLYFYNGLTNFDSNTGLPYVTDDTPNQVGVSKMTYLDGSVLTGYATQVSTYPNLDVRLKQRGVWKNDLITYGVPAINYDATKAFSNADKGIFTKFWEEYVAERYGVNTKVITCYLWITPAVFAQFDMNTFLKIDNRLYMLNKIIDYDCTKMQPTKCELVSLYNYYAYVTNPVSILYEFVDDTLVSHVPVDLFYPSSEGRIPYLSKGAVQEEIIVLPQTE